MNLIDRVILEWSYRTNKGYPDINNREDMRIFESMFGFTIAPRILCLNVSALFCISNPVVLSSNVNLVELSSNVRYSIVLATNNLILCLNVVVGIIF